MMSRRNALLAGIGLAGIAAYARNLFALGAHVGAERFEVSKTEAEWKQVLTPEQFQVLRQRGTEWIAENGPTSHHARLARETCSTEPSSRGTALTSFPLQRRRVGTVVGFR